MSIGRWSFEAGRAHARCFDFAGLRWCPLVSGMLLHVGVGRLLVFYLCVLYVPKGPRP